jgi:hypothetical protein
MADNKTKKVTSVTNLGTMQQAVFADAAAVIRVAESGLDWHPLGSITTAVLCQPNTPVLIYNSTGTVLFVAFGSQTVAAPTSAANGLPVPANSTVVYNSGVNSWVIGSAAGLFAYNADLL